MTVCIQQFISKHLVYAGRNVGCVVLGFCQVISSSLCVHHYCDDQTLQLCQYGRSSISDCSVL